MKQTPPQQNSSIDAISAPISFAEAVAIVAAHGAAILSDTMLDQQQCEISQALGRVLASAILADRDQPPFPRVTRDGFAVQAHDVANGTLLRVVGEFRAGEPWPPERPALLTGEAVEIMTGAALPPGADAVLMVEHAEEGAISPMKADRDDDGHSRFIRARSGRTVTAGENVVPRGSEAREGDCLLKAGTRLRPDEIALTAACGLPSVPVYSPPNVAIVATGDELIEPEAVIEPHQIYDSNSHALAALVSQSHAIPLRQRAARDRKDDLAACIQEALKIAPLLLLSGGVSMGRYDLVEEVLASLGAEFFFTGVRMQPGKPVVFGRVPAANGLPARFFFGLPGNPVSTMVTFRVFVEPLLAAISGEQQWQPRTALAILSSQVQSKLGLMRFLPAHLDATQSKPTVAPLRTQGSGDLAANARANCYLMVPEDCEFLAAGQAVRVLLR